MPNRMLRPVSVTEDDEQVDIGGRDLGKIQAGRDLDVQARVFRI